MITYFYRFIFIAFAISISLLTSVAQQTGDSEIDKLTAQCQEYFSTRKGIHLAEELSSLARKKGIHQRIFSGYKLKAGSMLNIGLYQQLIEFSDSLIKADIEHQDFETYILLLEYQSHSYLSLRQYRTALQIATDLYDDSSDYEKYSIIDNGDGTYTMEPQLFKRYEALSCMLRIYNAMQKYEEALHICTEALEITDKWSNELAAEHNDILRSIADISSSLTDPQEHIKWLHLCASKMTPPTDNSSISYTNETYNINLGVYEYSMMRYYLNINDLKNAYIYYNLVTQRFINNDNYYAIYTKLAAKAYYFYHSNQPKLAIAYADSTMKLTNDFKNQELLLLRLKASLEAHDYENSYEQLLNIINLKDSTHEAQMTSAINEQSVLMNVERLQRETARSEAQRIKVVYASILIVILISITFVILIYKQRQRRIEEQHKIIAEQNARLETEVRLKTQELADKNETITAHNRDLAIKNEIITKTNREMTDSMNYARLIQNSMLPELKQIMNSHVRGVFTIFHPYKIVSGDFYWAKAIDNKVAIVCADCTGHGVPGALLAMVGSTLLNDICANSIPSPGEILTILDRQFKDIIGQNNELKDGMDVALVIYDSATHKMQFSSARRQIYVATLDDVIEYNGTKRSIGDRDEKCQTLPFETTEIQLSAGNSVYLCSDGIIDQFGGQEINGPSGKRLKRSGLKRMISAISSMNMEAQGKEMERMIEHWKGTCVQVDDISLVAFQV